MRTLKGSGLFGRYRIYAYPISLKFSLNTRLKTIPYSYHIICRKEIFQMCLAVYKPFEICVHDEYCNINPSDPVLYAAY